MLKVYDFYLQCQCFTNIFRKLFRKERKRKSVYENSLYESINNKEDNDNNTGNDKDNNNNTNRNNNNNNNDKSNKYSEITI